MPEIFNCDGNALFHISLSAIELIKSPCYRKMIITRMTSRFNEDIIER